MGVKMEIIIAIAIALSVGGVGGGLIGYNIAPKTIYNIQNVYTSNEIKSDNQNIQTSFQGQITLVTPFTNININIKGITNLSVTHTNSSNFVSLTNIIK